MADNKRLVFQLSKEQIGIAEAEAIALAGYENMELHDDILIIESDFDDFNRLSHTKAVFEVLFESATNEIDQRVVEFDWENTIGKDFCVRVSMNNKDTEKKLGGIIYDLQTDPKVNLDDAETLVHFFFLENKVLCTKRIHKTDTNAFEERRSHLRPKSHPSTMHPKLARAFVNMTGIKPGKDKLIDPFCGCGGILIEAGLMKIDCEGSDIEDEMISRAKENLESFKIKADIKKKDATQIKQELNFVASDLPYGKATRSQDIELLYNKFSEVLKKHLKGTAVLGFPDFVNVKSILKKNMLTIDHEFTIYVHKSLSKKIFVVRN